MPLAELAAALAEAAAVIAAVEAYDARREAEALAAEQLDFTFDALPTTSARPRPYFTRHDRAAVATLHQQAHAHHVDLARVFARAS